jgi:hypothetical protein
MNYGIKGATFGFLSHDLTMTIILAWSTALRLRAVL